jgi:hypothetical protein
MIQFNVVCISVNLMTYNDKLTGRTEPACRRSDLQRGIKFAKQMPRYKLSALNAWVARFYL